jgi:hypothetical protein
LGRFLARQLYRERGWQLPATIGRVDDSSRAATALGFRCRTDFAAILTAMAAGVQLPFAHDPGFESPILSVGTPD